MSPMGKLKDLNIPNCSDLDKSQSFLPLGRRKILKIQLNSERVFSFRVEELLDSFNCQKHSLV